MDLAAFVSSAYREWFKTKSWQEGRPFVGGICARVRAADRKLPTMHDDTGHVTLLYSGSDY